jgi:hypothetical protein
MRTGESPDISQLKQSRQILRGAEPMRTGELPDISQLKQRRQAMRRAELMRTGESPYIGQLKQSRQIIRRAEPMRVTLHQPIQTKKADNEKRRNSERPIDSPAQ